MSTAAGGSRPRLDACVAAVAIAVVLLMIELVFRRPIHWDEFLHLSQTHAFRRGELLDVLQVMYTRLFFWLPELSTDSIGQIQVARTLLLLASVLSVTLVYKTAQQFTDRLSAGLAVLVYL